MLPFAYTELFFDFNKETLWFVSFCCRFKDFRAIFCEKKKFSEVNVNHAAVFYLQNTFPSFLKESSVGDNYLLEVGFIIFLRNIIWTDAEYDIDPILTKCQVLFTLHGTTSYTVVQIRWHFVNETFVSEAPARYRLDCNTRYYK